MRLILVMPLKSFDDYVKDEPRWAQMTERIAHLVANYYLRVLWDPAWEWPHDS